MEQALITVDGETFTVKEVEHIIRYAMKPPSRPRNIAVVDCDLYCVNNQALNELKCYDLYGGICVSLVKQIYGAMFKDGDRISMILKKQRSNGSKK